MGVRVIIHMFKIMRKPIKVGVRTYVMYAHCRTLAIHRLHFGITPKNSVRMLF